MTLKTRNLPLLTAFVAGNYVAFATVNGLPWEFLREIKLTGGILVFENPLVAVALHMAVLLLSYLVPVSIKNTLVFWRIRHPLPGCRAFSVLAQKDSRVDLVALETTHGALPMTPEDQNRLWYRIYKERQNEPIVLSSHGMWLLFRDMTAISLILLILLGTITYSTQGARGSFLYSGFLLVQYLIVSQAARNTGERFTCNVLAR